jgi:hypothetical protein
VTGTITVDDVDSNGQVVYFNTSPGTEITALTLSFSGNSAIPAFTADLSNVTGTQWDLDPVYGDGTGGPGFFKEGLRLFVTVSGIIYKYETGFSPLGSVFPIKGEVTNLATGGVTRTENFLMASSISVPDGGMTLALLGVAFVGLATLRRRLA